MGKRLLRLSFLLAFALWAAVAHASLVMLVGVESNLLVDDGRVIFIQADGSLTALDLQTGEILKRMPDLGLRGQIEAHGPYLYVGDAYSSTLTILDRKDFPTFFSTEHSGRSFLFGDKLIYSPTQTEVALLDVPSKTVEWSWKSDHNVVLLAATAEKVLVEQQIGNYFKLVLLHLSNGTPISKDGELQTSPGFQGFAWISGGRIALLSMRNPFETDSTVYTIRMEDGIGKILKEFDVPAEIAERVDFWTKPFNAGGFRFLPDSRFIADGEDAPEETPVHPLFIREAFFRAEADTLPSRASLDILKVPIPPVTSYQSIYALHYKSSGADWRSIIPYSKTDDTLEHATESGDLLLLSSTNGYVECVDRLTGNSRWVYSFPTGARQLSYSFPYGMPPTLKEQADAFDRAWDARPKSISLIPIPPALEAKPTNAPALQALRISKPVPIRFDPDVKNPYAEPLRKLLPLGWLVAFLPMSFLALFTLLTWRWLGPHAPVGRSWAAVLCMIAFTFSLNYVMVSRETLNMAKLSVAVSFLVIAVSAIQQYRQRKWIAVSIPLALSVVFIIGYWKVLIRL